MAGEWPVGWGQNDGLVNILNRDDAAIVSEILASGQHATHAEALSTGGLSLEERCNLLTSVGEECVNESEVMPLLQKKGDTFRLYDGFEPSGRMHIAQGVFKAENVNKCTRCGGTFVFWVADWFALMNDKMGGDLAKIKDVGRYLVEVWKAAGMRMDRVVFVWASDEITEHAALYWPQMLDVARRFTLARIKKCCQIMGRLENSLTAAQILYPLMQCTDIFFLRADVCQLGVDQRKVNMLARDYCDAAGLKHKPIILSHHMLYGLKAGQAKMSKSDADSAIFMEDSEADVERKIAAAYCPRVKDDDVAAAHMASDFGCGNEGVNKSSWEKLLNPCLDYVKHIVFASPDAVFYAGGRRFGSADDVGMAFVSGELSEADLKKGLAAAINGLLEPVREHFGKDQAAAALLERVKAYKRDSTASSSPGRSANDDTGLLNDALKRALEKSAAWHKDFADANTAIAVGDKKICVVFAPPPAPDFTLGDALTLATCFERAAIEGYAPLLVVADWSALALGCFAGDAKASAAALRLVASAAANLYGLLRPVGPRAALLRQSDAILERPSDYWIDVINAGRAFPLCDVQHAVGQTELDSAENKTGPIIAALLRVADVRAACADLVVEAAEPSPSNLAATRLNVHVVTLCKVSTRLQPPAPDDVPDDDVDRDFFLYDALDATKRKIKRAFCEPGNLGFNPPLAIVEFLLRRHIIDAIRIKRKAENGGNADYADIAQLRRDFETQALHPGDLKPAVVELLNATLVKTLVDSVNRAHNAKPALAALKAFNKKVNKPTKRK